MKPIHIRQFWDATMPRYRVFVDGKRLIDPTHYDSEFYPSEMPSVLRRLVAERPMNMERQAL